MTKPKIVLVVGARHSGTSLLASYLGAHPDISMIFEDTDQNFLKMYGTKYVGNKLVLNQQIRRTQRASKWGYAVNRYWYWKHGWGPFRPYPTSKWSIQDYVENEAKIIYIIRGSRDNVNSIIKRAGQRVSEREAFSYLDKCTQEISPYDYTSVSYETLVSNPALELEWICQSAKIKYSKKMLDGPKSNWRYL